ncbi:MAG TPA: SNF2-related protein [Bacteroidia bacterium]|nr:SNF2-related protein [Bacteroidia bacterium]
MRDPLTEYILENTTLPEITYTELLNHSSELIDTGKRNFFDIQPQVLEVNFGVFSNPSSSFDFPMVSVSQVNNSVMLSCSCKTPKKKLCEHQTQVLYNIIDKSYFTIFFDDRLRNQKIKEVARDYGLEREDNLDDYFEVQYINKSISIKPKVKGLIPFNQSNVVSLKECLLPLSKKTEVSEQKEKTIVVLKKHKHYEQLNIELYEGNATKEGKIKNPLTEADPLKLIWKADQLDHAKFYTAVSSFQHKFDAAQPEADIQSLKMILKNPLKLEAYIHDKKLSESVNASSIVPIELKLLKADIRLSVFKKNPFYEISGELFIHEKAYSFKSLSIKHRYFVQIGDTWYLIPNINLLRVIDYFKTNNEKVLIHASKFEEFKTSILDQLENSVTINYAYIKSATKKQMAELGIEKDKEKIIYLSQQENYVSIVPVIKYGNVEVPVFSKKQLYDTDQNGNVFKVERDHELEEQFISILMRQHPYFVEQLYEGEYFYLHIDKFMDENWFLDVFEEWKNQHILVLGFNDIKKNKLNSNKASVSVSVSTGIDWFNATLKVKFGKQAATLKQVHKAIKDKSKYIHLDDGTLGILPSEWINKFARYFRAGELIDEMIRIPKSNFVEMSELFEKEVLSKEVERELAMYESKLKNIEHIPEVTIPKELHAELRDYQKQGLNWLNLLDDFNFGACLADDMGLGKTIQIIAFILSQRHKSTYAKATADTVRTNLIVVPTSLLFNWQQEVSRFAPSIKLFTHYGANRLMDIKQFDTYEIILTTYGMLVSDIHFLKDFKFNYIFLDESQAIKNPLSQRYKAARALQARNRVVLTGTPIENNTFDIYGQLSFACPGLLGNKQYFKDTYALPIDQFQDYRRAEELQKKIKPFILRRTKKEVATELPEKTEMVIYCEMGEEQRKIYETCEKELRDFIAASNQDEITTNSMHVLTGLTKLRQICNAPALLKDEGHTDVSAKMEVLLEQIENKSTQHKILVFSQFVTMLDLIKVELEKKAVPFEYLTGQTKNRSSKVTSFQKDESIRVFLISLKAGGTGLNLTEADYVYLVDPWWNPAVENQAIDRSYRIGQDKHVIAVRLICPDTIEEKIMKLQESKSKLANDLIKTDESVLKSLSKKELLNMLS